MTDFMTEGPATVGDAIREVDDCQGFATMSDATLVGAMAPRIEDALAEAYSRYGSSVYGLARNLCGPKLTEDVTHEVFLALWHRPGAFDLDLGSLASHLLAAAHRCAVAILRSDTGERPERAKPPIEPYDRGSKALALGASEKLGAFLSGLSETQRQAIVLAYFGGYTYREVAARLHRTDEEVRRAIGTGLTRLDSYWNIKTTIEPTGTNHHG